MPPKSGSKAYRDQQRDRLARLGVDGHQLIEQLVTDLLRCRYRPREAWRLACELTQDEVAAQFNQIRGDPDIRMRGSRICEYEKWPASGVRPSVRTLKILAAVYGTTWDRLVDIDDLEKMAAHERQAFLDISDLRHGDPLNLPEQRQNHCYPPPPRSGKETQLNRPTATDKPAITHDQLTTPPPPECPSEQSAGGLPSEVIHFTGRDGPMTQLTARLATQHIRGTVVTIYAIDGKAGIGTTAFARHAAHQLTPRYPDGVIWVDLHGHTPGRQPREPTDALEQMLRQLDMPPEEISADLVSRQDLWRRHIHTRRMLIVLDNARTSDQVLPLLPEEQ